jgi:hypothetical protein
MQRIYIAGPCSGIKDMNRPAFNAEAARLRALGFDVVSPVELCPEPNLTWGEYMRRDIPAMLTCDTIALLPGHEMSRGALLEITIGRALNMRIVLAADITSGAEHQDTVHAELEALA